MDDRIKHYKPNDRTELPANVIKQLILLRTIPKIQSSKACAAVSGPRAVVWALLL